MLRLVALPFAILLGVVSFGLIAGGVSILGEEAAGDERENGALLDLDVASDDADEADPSGAIAGASMLGFGILGFIGAIALLIASLSGGKRDAAVLAQQQQQQQQQVVVVNRPDGSVEVHERH